MTTSHDIQKEYEKEKELKKSDVDSIFTWMKQELHLPKITELEVITFLHSCNFDVDATQKTIDNHFTMKTMCKEIFSMRDPTTEFMQQVFKTITNAMMPKLTPDGYRILVLRLLDTNPKNIIIAQYYNIFDMTISLYLHTHGTANGLAVVIDSTGISWGHFLKLRLNIARHFTNYLQEGMPVRLKSMNLVNNVPFVDKILSLFKPFMKKEFKELIYVMDNIEDLYEKIPKNCLPSEYGGTLKSVLSFSEDTKRHMIANAEFYRRQETQLVDESKRIRKHRSWNPFW